jgi:hypothetical protein
MYFYENIRAGQGFLASTESVCKSVADAIPNLLYQALCNNKPIELSNAEMARQKLNYLYFNLVEAGFTSEPEEYWYSSARDYTGKKGLLEIEFL